MEKKWNETWELIKEDENGAWNKEDIIISSPVVQLFKDGKKLPIVANIIIKDSNLRNECFGIDVLFYNDETLTKYNNKNDIHYSLNEHVENLLFPVDKINFEYNGKRFMFNIKTNDDMKNSGFSFSYEFFEFLDKVMSDTKETNVFNMQMKMEINGVLSDITGQFPIENLKESLSEFFEIAFKLKYQNVIKNMQKTDNLIASTKVYKV